MRGIIYDRNNVPLVSNKPVFNLRVVPVDLLRQPEVSGIIAYLAGTISELPEETTAKIEKLAHFSVPITLKHNISKELALALKAKFSDNPAVIVEVANQRNYIDAPYFFHLLGHIGKINQTEYQESSEYFIDDWLGRTGLELRYEELLRGNYGEQIVEINAKGQIQNVFSTKEPEIGKDIVLSIDAGLQKKLYESLQQMLRGLNTNRAAGIAINPKTGKILAMVSLPSLDNNKFISGFSEEEFEEVVNSSSKPLFNRVISGTYPPGSTIKPLVALAALEEEIISPKESLLCAGSLAIPNKYLPGISHVFHDWKTHGPTNLVKAIAESCNVYFYTIGGGYGNIKGLGVTKISQYLRKFGLGEDSGIDLSGEADGFVPDAQWKKETKKEEWFTGDTYNISIGQGDILTTPLQVALFTAAIANNGTMYSPQLINRVGEEIVLPQITKEKIIDNQEAFDLVKQGMREAIISGSARYLSDLSVNVAGKTGTSQTPSGLYHAWFTSFAPYEDPEIVLTILIENGGEGSSVAVPVAKEVFKTYFKL